MIAIISSVERRRYREGHKRGMRERLLDEEDDYFDRTDRKSKRDRRDGGSQKKVLDSKEILQEKLAYKKKMLQYYEQQLKKCESNPVV